MNYTFKFTHREWVRHSMLSTIEGYVTGLSIDEAGVEWVEVAYAKDGGKTTAYFRASELERFEPVVNGFGEKR